MNIPMTLGGPESDVVKIGWAYIDFSGTTQHLLNVADKNAPL